MPIIFPTGPSNGEVFSSAGKSWIYDSAENKWIAGSGPVGPTGPTGPQSTVTGPTGPTGTWSLAQTIETKTSAYTIQTGDAGKLILMNATQNFTIDSTTGFSQGQRVDVIRASSGACNIVQGSGATVTGTPGLKLRDQYSAASIVCISTDSYYVIGDLSA